MDERFEEGIRLFNDEEFFDAHEVWEDLWQGYRGDDRTFLQALIQVAAGFYHAQCRNARGAMSQLSKGLAKLAEYVPLHQTVRTASLIRNTDRWLRQYETGSPEDEVAGGFPKIERTI